MATPKWYRSVPLARIEEFEALGWLIHPEHRSSSYFVEMVWTGPGDPPDVIAKREAEQRDEASA